MSVLQKIAEHKREELAEVKRRVPLTQLQDEIAALTSSPRPFLSHDLSKTSRLILEIKPFSPSAGQIVSTFADGENSFDPSPWVEIYQRHGVAMSVLTDARHFGGSLTLLSQVRSLTSLPLLRKDFTLEAYQLCEARAAGADAILLIVKLLPNLSLLSELADQARLLGLTPVIEIQNEAELEMALMMAQPDRDVVLVNNRNLDTLVLNLKTTLTLGPKIPDGLQWIAASGIETAQDLSMLQPVARNFLIGTAAMKRPLTSLDDFLVSLRHVLENSRSRDKCRL